MLIDTDKVVCKSEIAEMAFVSPSAVSNWIKRDVGFPPPLVSLRIGDLWLREDVEAWIADRKMTTEAARESAINYHKNQLRRLGYEG